MYDKEDIYDNEIAPLMKQILAICKREDLPMIAQFYLKEKRDEDEDENPMFCSSVILPPKEDMSPDAYKQLRAIRDIMKYGVDGKPFVAAMTIRTGG
jgi:hypothetical protein